jgi:1-deoxy-D-xylulose-5-phosphate synthase
MQVAASHDALVTIEEGAIMGGAGSAVGECLAQSGVLKPLVQLGLADAFTTHGDPAKLLAMQGLDTAGIVNTIREKLGGFVQAQAPLLTVVA